jgi:hypothetical protein
MNGKKEENNSKNSGHPLMLGTGMAGMAHPLTRSPLTLYIVFYYGRIPSKLEKTLNNVWQNTLHSEVT